MQFKKAMTCAMAIAMVSGCSGTSTDTSSATSTTTTSSTVTIAVTNDMTTMDSSLVTDGTSFNMISLCQSGLVQYNEEKELIGDIAESWDISDDSMTYTFHLRDAKWSNGEDITANDFVYGFQRLVDPDTGSEYSYFASSVNIENAAECAAGEKPVEELGVEATDDHTFVVHLSAPCSFFLSCMASPQFLPLNQEYVESQGDQYALSVDTMIYSGVYTMTEWVQGNSYTFTHNENYWDADNYPQETIVVQCIQDAQTAMLQYESGSLDYLDLTGEMVDTYKDTEGYHSTLTASSWYLCPNMDDEYLSNANLRKAINYAIDRDTIVNDVLKTGGVALEGLIATGLVSDSNGTDFRDISKDMTEYDPEKAQEYYAKAVEELGKDAVIDIVYDDADDSTKVAENVQQMIETNCPGITVTLNGKPKKTRIQLMLSHDFSIGLTKWGPDYADPQSYLDLFTTGFSMNFGNYSNAEFDALEEEATKGEASTNIDTRLSTMAKAEQILVEEDTCLMPIYQEGGATLVNPEVEGYFSLVLGTGTWRHLHKA